MNSARSRWRGPGLALAGLLLYSLFLVTTLPAHWLGEALGRATNGVARLHNTHGGLWQGSGVLTIQTGGASPFSAPLDWEIHPLWLLAGRLDASVRTRGDTRLQAQLRIGYRQWRLQEVEGELAASAIASLYAPAALIGPTGTLQFNAGDIALDADGWSGEARLTWLGAGGRLGGIGELGDYLLVVSGQDGAAGLRVETLRGAVQLNARGHWQPAGDGMLQLEGTLAASETRAASLAPLLALLNARPEGGRHAFRYNGRMRLPRLLGGPA